MLEMKVRFPMGMFDKHRLFTLPVPQNYISEDILKTDFKSFLSGYYHLW